ncbi:MAG: response regulator [Paludibacterium sp.]|uniref:response regulator n=1 Tax=Paludibacterium sp. TaxID=1917523 RepID=UPI0025D3319F|nr:response regulator [Paludibacterium sp.]MBV8046077.1 response regulator [Paludibacterium sp.]MBV8646166.1 response regulator [Paludibacterium sp.]
MRILVVEDDPLIGDGLKAGLAQLGFAVDWLISGKEALHAMDAAPYDGAVLDLGLPGCDGMTVLAAWRRQGHSLPVLVLTARDAINDRVAGLDAGADDYLIKPFALIEVAARLRAMLRRSQGLSSHLLTHGDVSFDPAARCAYLCDRPVELTARELAILEVLLLNKGRVLPRELIEEKLYSWDHDLESNAIEVHIHHLRKKLGRHLIRTVRGIGYTLGSEA